MSRQPDLFHCIPHRSPIPSGIVALIGGITADRPIFGLYKDNREIFIYAPEADHLKEEIDEEDEFYEYKIIEQNRKVFDFYLSMISELLPQVHFGKTRSAFLIPSPLGYFIRLRDFPVNQSLACKPLGEMISEDDIEVTVWGGMSDRRGIWKTHNLKIDIFYAWNPTLLRILDYTMHGYNYAQGLDLTFKVYGHLVDRNDHKRILGLVSEAAFGRSIQCSDKNLIFSAISRLQARGCIYKGCLTNRFMIADDKVRFLELNLITRPYRNLDDPRSWEKLEVDAQQFHWNELDRLFEELVEFGQYGNNRLPLLHFTANSDNILAISCNTSTYPRISEVYSIHDILANNPGFVLTAMTSEYAEEDTPHNSQYLNRTRRLVLPLIPRRMVISNIPRAPSAGEISRGQQSHHRDPRRHQITLSHYPSYMRSRGHGAKDSRALTNSENTVSGRTLN